MPPTHLAEHLAQCLSGPYLQGRRTSHGPDHRVPHQFPEPDRSRDLDGWTSHPSEDAAHTWAGFSTGKWEGDILTVTTTHLKEYILKRNGVPHSDRATMIEHFMRHGDFLTIVQIVTDPIYYEEPFIQSTDFALDLHGTEAPVLCEIGEETDHPRGWVPHRSPRAGGEGLRGVRQEA